MTISYDKIWLKGKLSMHQEKMTILGVSKVSENVLSSAALWWRAFL